MAIANSSSLSLIDQLSIAVGGGGNLGVAFLPNLRSFTEGKFGDGGVNQARKWPQLSLTHTLTFR